MEQSNYTIDITPHQCAGCYRCVRACSTGAITVHNHRASIAQSECTRCGSCLQACPHGMIAVRDDVATVRRLLKSTETVFVSLDPMWVGEYPTITPQRMVEALTLLGFAGVGETLLGQIKYDEAVREQLQRNPRTAISTRCPVVVRLLQHHYPELAERLLPVAHPAVLHARMIRRWSGQGAKVVYITPCVAAKPNADEISELDAVLTFDELRRWMHEEGVEFDMIPGNAGYRFTPGDADYHPSQALDDTAIHIRCSGLSAVRELLEKSALTSVADTREPVLMELWGCTGGCAGAHSEQPASTLEKTLACQRFYNDRKPENPIYKLPFIATVASYPAEPAARFQVAASQIEAALASIGKYTERDMHNCNGCGYETCREFARALCIGRAEPEMCLSYTRALAQKKFSALLKRMPSGVMLVDGERKIVEANRHMAHLLGPQVEQLFDKRPGLRRVPLQEVAPFGDLLDEALRTGREIAEQDIRLKGKLLHISTFTVEPHTLVGVMVSSLTLSGVQSDEMIQRTRQVIRENLETVQQIACLLGENASRTEAILNSIVTAAADDHEAR